MAFFKILSENPEDYESSDEPSEIADHDIESIYVQQSEIENHVDIVLESGEHFCIPIKWLIESARQNKFQSYYKSWLH